MLFRLKIVDEVMSMICCNIFPNGVIIFSRDCSCKDDWHERRHFLIGSVSTLATIFVHSHTASSFLRRLSGRTPDCTSMGGRVVPMVLGKLTVPGRPTIWITVGQVPTALAVGAGWGCLDVLLSSVLSFLFLPLFGRRPDIDSTS